MDALIGYSSLRPFLIGVALFMIAVAALIVWRCFFMPRIFLSILRRLNVITGPHLKAVTSALVNNLVKAGNRYFRKSFAATPFRKRLLFLPFCLRPADCPALLDPDLGYNCPQVCPDCELGKVRQEALALGYGGVYVVPSSRILRRKEIAPSDHFMLDKVRRHQPGAVLGVVCQWYVHHRLFANYSIGRKGYQTGPGSYRAVVQGVLLEDMNCRQASVDWGQVRKRLHLRSKGRSILRYGRSVHSG